jgi:two-component system nitrate/nitrite sensor histidine kinase NarX
MARRQLSVVQDSDRPAAGRVDERASVGERPKSLLDSPGLEAMLDRGLRAIAALTGARGGAIRLVSPDGRAMRLVSAVGLSPESLAEEQVVALDCGICGAALRSDDMRLDSRPQVCARRIGAFAGESECGPVLAVPLHCAGKAIGIFNLFFAESSRPPADIAALLEPTAQMLDLVLNNAFVEHERLRSSLVAERQMLAGEVHDSLAQGLAYMRMRMPLLHDAIRDGERDHALKYFQDVNGAMGEAHARLRELITQFRHAVDQGLLQALETTARTFEDRTGVKLTIENRAANMRLAPDQEVQVYQIVQESLANVIKHAGARSARIILESGARGIRISVEDDGCGVARRARHGANGVEHFGLDIMRERAQRIGGSLEIRSTPGKGTRVRLLLPAKPRQEA